MATTTSAARIAELENLRRSIVMVDPEQPCSTLTNRQAVDLVAELIAALTPAEPVRPGKR